VGGLIVSHKRTEFGQEGGAQKIKWEIKQNFETEIPFFTAGV
jgi:hypothetical protein